jgi:hypothetical protein
LKRTFLNKLRPHAIGRRDHWMRFVQMQASKEDVEAMYPRIQHGATLLVDRHYNSFLPHRAAGVNICVVRLREHALVRSLDVTGRQLVLRPEQSRVPLEMMTIDPKERYAERILGRVCWAGYEV